MSEEIEDILDELGYKAGVYLNQKTRNEAFNDDDYYCYVLLNYIVEKDKEIERLNNIINKFEIWLLEHSKVDYGCAESIVHEQLALGIAFNYLQELKGQDNAN